MGRKAIFSAEMIQEMITEKETNGTSIRKQCETKGYVYQSAVAAAKRLGLKVEKKAKATKELVTA